MWIMDKKKWKNGEFIRWSVNKKEGKKERKKKKNI